MTTALLLSGGMDSAALACWKRPELGITLDYGQISAAGEIRAARQICKEYGIRHDVITVDCRALGSGDLVARPCLQIAPVSEWWPFRNQLLVTLAAMRCVAMGVGELLIGSVRSDSVHVDGRADFYERLGRLVTMQEGHIQLSVPALDFTTTELVRISEIERSVLAWTHSCHSAVYACGRCRGCNKHLEVLQELGYAMD